MEQKLIYENENLAHAVAFTATLLDYDAPAEFKFGGYDLQITRVRDAIYDPHKSCNVPSDVCAVKDLTGEIPVDDMQEFTGYVLDIMEDFGLLNPETEEE